MTRHLTDLLEALSHALAPSCQAVRPVLAFALQAGAGLALQLSWELWRAAEAVAAAPTVRTAAPVREPLDPRINCSGGKA